MRFSVVLYLAGHKHPSLPDDSEASALLTLDASAQVTFNPGPRWLLKSRGDSGGDFRTTLDCDVSRSRTPFQRKKHAGVHSTDMEDDANDKILCQTVSEQLERESIDPPSPSPGKRTIARKSDSTVS